MKTVIFILLLCVSRAVRADNITNLYIGQPLSIGMELTTVPFGAVYTQNGNVEIFEQFQTNSSGAGTVGYLAGVLLFTPTHTGTITAISWYGSNTNSSAKIRYYIYNHTGDIGGVPTTIVGSPWEDTPGVQSLGWHTITGLSIGVTSGQAYWLAEEGDTANAIISYYGTDISNPSRWYIGRNYTDPYSNPVVGANGLSDSIAFSFSVSISY